MYEYRARALRVKGPLTLKCEIDLGFSIMFTRDVRLAHLAQPDTKDRKEVTALVAEWLENNEEFTLESVEDKREKFGRYLGVLHGDDGSNLNDLLLKSGLVGPYSEESV